MYLLGFFFLTPRSIVCSFFRPKYMRERESHIESGGGGGNDIIYDVMLAIKLLIVMNLRHEYVAFLNLRIYRVMCVFV